MNGKANCGSINITQQQKGVSYWYMQQIGGNYAAWTKSISNGYTHIVWSHEYNILEMTKYRNRVQISSYQR